MPGNFADALLKAGVISKEKMETEIAREERIKQDIENRKQREEENRREAARAEHEAQMAFIKPIQVLYRTAATTHLTQELVYAFTPSSVASRWYGDDINRICSICKKGILTVEQALSKPVLEAHANAVLNSLHREAVAIKEGKESGPIDISEDLLNFRKATGGKILGVASPDSDRILCHNCWERLSAWIEHEIIQGNRDINDIITRKRISMAKKPTV
jgi:hypothetical protein